MFPRKANSCRRYQEQILVVLFCVAVGAVYALSVLAIRVLNPFDTSWITGDPAQSYLGWLHFRREERLTLPLGWVTTLGYPLGAPIAYSDSIPPVATALWFFRNLLPADFQYLGLYFVLCCVLQCYFGFRICRTFAKDNLLVCILGAMFFLTSAVFTWRANGHFALASHWLILAVLERFLNPCRLSSTTSILYVGVLCFLAGSISPYITVMVLLIVAAAYMRMVRPVGWNRTVGGMTIAVGGAGAGLLLFGFLQPTQLFHYASEGGYGLYSMNLLAPIDPVYPGSLLPPAPKIGSGQIEGYNYFGLGLIVMAAAAVLRRPGILRRLVSRDALFGWFIVVISLGLALSPTVSAGSHVLFHVPDPVYDALSTFRASGRFFWPAYYVIMAAVLAGTYSAFGRSSPPVLLAAFLIQVVDLAPLREWNELTSHAAKISDDEPTWRSLGATHKHLVVIPPYQCNPEDTPGGLKGFWLYGKLAADQKMSTNSFHPARMSAKQVEFFCGVQMHQIERDGMAPDTAYVVNPSYMMQISDEALRDHRCDRRGSVALCTYQLGGGRDPSLVELLPAVDIGRLVEFGSANPVVRSFATNGWGNVEPAGRWMLGPEATMILRLPAGSNGLDLHLDIVSFSPPGHLQRVDIQAGSKFLAEWHFDMKNAESQQTLHIAPGDFGPNGVVVLRFMLPDAVSPRSLGRGRDHRKLGIMLRRFWVTEAPIPLEFDAREESIPDLLLK